MLQKQFITISENDGADIVRIDARLTVEIIPAEEGGYCVSCPALRGVHSQGGTVKEAKANIKEAVECFIETCFERGILRDALARRGFFAPDKPRRRRRKAAPPNARIARIPVRIPLMAHC